MGRLNKFVVWALLAAALGGATGPPAAAPPIPAERILLGQVNAYAGTMYALARERFMAHEAQHETWVIRVHASVDWTSFKKFRQGSLVVVSIPVYSFELEGARLYAAHYNALTTEKADQLALEGKYDEALKIYLLLERFNEGFAPEDDPRERVRCAQHLLRKENAAEALGTLRSLRTSHAPSTYELVETQPPLTTTNILAIDISLQPK